MTGAAHTRCTLFKSKNNFVESHCDGEIQFLVKKGAKELG